MWVTQKFSFLKTSSDYNSDSDLKNNDSTKESYPKKVDKNDNKVREDGCENIHWVCSITFYVTCIISGAEAAKHKILKLFNCLIDWL